MIGFGSDLTPAENNPQQPETDFSQLTEEEKALLREEYAEQLKLALLTLATASEVSEPERKTRPAGFSLPEQN